MSDERTATATDIRLGQRVRSRRLEIGMSQERLADLLGVTFQQVQKYEKGVNRIAASRLLDISIALNSPIQDFYAGLAGGILCDDGVTVSVTQSLATAEGAGMAALFARIKRKSVRQRVYALAAAVVEDSA